MDRFRFALCGSAPVPVEVLKAFESLHCPVIEGYGLSINLPVPPSILDERRRAGSVGRRSERGARLDDNDNELGPRQIGIVLRGSNIMKGYYKMRGHTRSFSQDSFGDPVPDDDRFFVVDRKSDLIIRAGRILPGNR